MNFNKAKERIGGRYKVIGDSLNHIVINLNLPKNARILDIGTGDGKMAITLALNGFKVITGEPEDDDSKYAKKNWLENAKKVGAEDLITFSPIRAENLSYENESFDAIFMYGTLHHVNHIETSLKECLRVLKKKGVICLIEPNNEMINHIKKKNPNHPDAVDPTDLIKDFFVNINIIKEPNVIGYIIKKS